MFKKYAHKVFLDWMESDRESFLSLLDKGNTLIDLGCGNARLTKVCASKLKAKEVLGIDKFGKSTTIKIIMGDLNRRLPVKGESFDVAISHYSIEHLYDPAMFIQETYRILKKGGYAVVATDNLSSWPNIFSLVMGYQPFTLTTGLSKRAIGNPFALRSNLGEIRDQGINRQWRGYGEYSHNKTFAYQALVEAYQEYGFKVEKVVGIGYFPFSGWLAKTVANIDKRHAHFLHLKVRK